MKFQHWIRSRVFKIILCAIGGFLALLGVLHAGMVIGYRKAAFSFGSGDNYYRMFGNRHRHFGREFPFQGGISEAHGAAGKILSISLPSFTVEGRDNIEKTILIKDDTLIRRFRDAIKPVDLKEGDEVVVIGAPNGQAQIEAKLIRVVPLMPFGSRAENRPRI